MIFVNSMSDLFHEKVSDDDILDLFSIMNQANWHTFQVLTKRPKRLLELSERIDWTKNIWMGVSVENKDALIRCELLKECGAKVKFISAEPLLESINEINLNGIDWLIVGGESANVALQVFSERYEEYGNEKIIISIDHIIYTQALILCHKCFVNDYCDVSLNTNAVQTLHKALTSPYNTYSFAKTDSFNYQSVIEKIVYNTLSNKELVYQEAYTCLEDLFKIFSES